ncbi:EbsA family protein [Lacticaseibacillus zhaodongensis]|uniref:EbsA family protein n=1 Tax=Lacticaseibacillus zhaodongensis TaxID=2668065 RepID=UPI0012D2EA2E|nr:EbsA family protein [Lacticaseibacillus zhaodongensis]
MRYKFMYQPGRIEAFIFWGLITSALALAIVLQMEAIGISYLALILALATILVAVLETIRYQGEVHAGTLSLHKFLRSNTLTIPLKDVQVEQLRSKTIMLHNTPYGDLEITTWRNAESIADQLH